MRFLRHSSGGRWQGRRPPGRRGPGGMALSARRRPGYPLVGCAPAEPASVSPGWKKLPQGPDKSNRKQDWGRDSSHHGSREWGSGKKV